MHDEHVIHGAGVHTFLRPDPCIKYHKTVLQLERLASGIHQVSENEQEKKREHPELDAGMIRTMCGKPCEHAHHQQNPEQNDAAER